MNRLTSLLKNQRGAVTVEMAFVIMGFVFLLVMIVDFGTVMLRQSNLERTNTSLASVFREREALYHENYTLPKFAAEVITQEQTNQLGRLAVKLLNEPDLSMRVEAVYFTNNPAITVDRTVAFTFGSTPCGQNLEPLTSFNHLSPYSGLNRWIPLYRVTTCIPGKASWYKKIISHDDSNSGIVDGMIASNITLPR